MGWRFRRSIKIAPGVRLNVSKSGLGMSVGVRGARVGISPNGRTYTSVGIPGTGLYAINYSGTGRRQSGVSASEAGPLDVAGCLLVSLLVVEFLVLLVAPIVGGALLCATGIAYYAHRQTPPQKLKQKLKEAAPFLESGDYEKALPLLKEAEQIQPSDQETQYIIASAFNNSGRFDEGLPYLERLREEAPDSPDVTMLLANAYFRTKRYQDAIPLVQKIPEESPWYLKAISMLGACFAEQKQYDLAIEAWKNAPLRKRKLDDDLKEIHYNLADTYLELGDKKKAARHLKRIVSQDAEYLDVRDRLENISD